MNLVDVFRLTVERQPDHPAIIGPGEHDVLLYTELRQKIEVLAEQLKALGIGPGASVGLHYPSGREYILLTYAVWSCGGCIVPIATELLPTEKLKIVREIHMDWVISEAKSANVVEPCCAGAARTIAPEIVLLRAKSFREHPRDFSGTNAAFLRFTSGTTGTSKGVVLSHETILERIKAANDVLEIGPRDRVIWLLSMSYHFAVSIVAYLSFGATTVLCKNHLGRTIIETTRVNEGTLIYGSPVHYEMMAHDRGSAMLPSLRLAISTASSLRRDIADAFSRRFGKPLSEAYGIIEVGLPCINVDNPSEKRGSVGKLLPAYQLRLDDSGLGDEMKAIKLKGPGILDAYYEPWQPRPEIMKDGWFATGDLGRMDEDGYLYIVGRSKEMVNVAGMKFFPQEVEAALALHPAIREACVYSHPHKRLGEVAHAQVVLAEGIGAPPAEAELIEHCAKHLAPFKVPEKIECVSALAKTASGKLIRRELSPRDIQP